MGSYKAPSEIQCRGNLPAPSACEVVLEEMFADTTVQTFGPRADTLVTVPLPYVVQSGKPAIQLFPSILSLLSDTVSDRRQPLPAQDIRHFVRLGFGQSFVVRGLGSNGCNLVSLRQELQRRHAPRHRQVSYSLCACRPPPIPKRKEQN